MVVGMRANRFVLSMLTLIAMNVSIPAKAENVIDNLENIKITATLSMIQGIESAYQAFKDQYNALPGDLDDAFKRLPNCNRDNCGSGNNDQQIGPDKLLPITMFHDERLLFWNHLKKAKLIDGYKDDSLLLEWGEALPKSPLGGGFHVFSVQEDHLPLAFKDTHFKEGLHLILTNDVNGDFSDPHAHFLTARQAHDLDRKMDDALPLSGAVVAVGDESCLVKDKEQIKYAVSEQPCFSLYIRLR